MTADDIRACFRKYYQDRFNETGLFEFGVCGEGFYSQVVFDAFIITPHRQVMKGFEFKVSRQDFLADLKPKKRHRSNYPADQPKWKYYLQFCNLFYWVCPEGLIKPEEVEAPAGLIWIENKAPSFFGYLALKKRPRRIDPAPDLAMQRKVLFLFASRAKTREGKYF
jgi:hypothetical protein